MQQVVSTCLSSSWFWGTLLHSPPHLHPCPLHLSSPASQSFIATRKGVSFAGGGVSTVHTSHKLQWNLLHFREQPFFILCREVVLFRRSFVWARPLSECQSLLSLGVSFTLHIPLSCTHVRTCNSSSVRFSPSSFATRFRLLKDILPWGAKQTSKDNFTESHENSMLVRKKWSSLCRRHQIIGRLWGFLPLNPSLPRG